MLKLIKTNEDLLIYEGIVKYSQHQYDTIVVDNKTYTNTICVDKESSVDSLRKDRSNLFEKHEYKFNLIDYKINIENYFGFSNPLSIIADNYHGSSNYYVCAIVQAFELGLLDDRIKSIFTGKADHYNYYPRNYRDSLNEVLKSMKINIPMYSYGFNNILYYTISVRDLFNVDQHLVPENIKEMFLTKNIHINTNNKLKEVQKLLIKKVELCNQ